MASLVWEACHWWQCFCPALVAGLISPWNLPLYLLTWKVAPAIAAGNTVIAKPSELTSVTAWMMCKLLEKAGKLAVGLERHRIGFGVASVVGFSHLGVAEILF